MLIIYHTPPITPDMLLAYLHSRATQKSSRIILRNWLIKQDTVF